MQDHKLLIYKDSVFTWCHQRSLQSRKFWQNSGNGLGNGLTMASKTAGQAINEMPPGIFSTISKVRPTGSLQARKGATGAVSLYWRYSIGTSSERVLVGIYDSAAPPKSLTPSANGYSIAAAIRAAEQLAADHFDHRDAGGRPALLAASREAERAAAEAKRQAANSSLKHLLNAYCDHLQAIGRSSHRDARSIFQLHVFEAFPATAALPAREVSGDAFADMMRRLIDAGKGRTANKLRSYCRAAYQTAKAARSKPSIPLSFKNFGISANPVSETEPDESQNRADRHPLSADELRKYWGLIKSEPGFRAALLRVHLLTGGQRIEQLVKLHTENILNNSFVLFDGKGRPGRPPRQHTVPLTRLAKQSLADCKPAGKHALSTDGGETHVAATTLSDWATEMACSHIEDFQAKRIRSGVETLLASAGVPSDIRGRLQSHGVSGVQSRHYDGHDYLPEKRAALETLYRLLNPSSRSTSRKHKGRPVASKHGLQHEPLVSSLSVA